MTSEEIEKKGAELIVKLNEKFDKCDWKKAPADMVPKRFSLKFSSGEILIGMESILVFNNNAICVLEYKPKKYNEAGVLAMWGKIQEKIQAPIDAHILTIIDELDKL